MNDYIRLQLKLKWGFNRNNHKASAIMTAIATLLAVLVVLALVLVLTYVLKTSLHVAPKQLLVLYLTLLEVGLIIGATGMQIKRLYRPGDLAITARFPLSPFQIFASGLILNYIDLWIYSTLFLLPVMLVFGFAAGCLSLSYALGMLLGIIFMPLIPFALSVFIAIPVMYITSFLEKHGIARIIIFVIFLAGCFALYYYILTVLAHFFIHRNWETGTLEIWQKVLTALDSYYNPAYYLGNVVFFERFGLGLGVLLGAGALLLLVGIALAKGICVNVRNKALESGENAAVKRTEIDDYGSAKAIFRYTFNEMLRSKTYSYFYLGVAISTPVMVFFCNRLVGIIGTAEMGAGINFGVSMLVVSMFMAMICSFTGEILSVDGKRFYITKLVPVSYRSQLGVKAALHICVSYGALILSTIILAALEFLNVRELLVLFWAEVIFVVGLVFNGINLNLANPNLKPKANGDAEEINIIFMLLIGFAIAALFGAGCILLPKSVERGKLWAYILAGGAAFVYALINLVVFLTTANRKYSKIEL